MDARNNNCPTSGSEMLFDPIFTKCLYKRGLEIASDPELDLLWITELSEIAKLLDEVIGQLEPINGEYPNNCPSN